MKMADHFSLGGLPLFLHSILHSKHLPPITWRKTVVPFFLYGKLKAQNTISKKGREFPFR